MILLILTAIFLILALIHGSLILLNLPNYEGRCAKVGNIDVCGTFIKDFNSYIDKINIANRTANIVALIGYFVASLTTLISFFQIRKKQHGPS